MADTFTFMWLEKTFQVTQDEILTYANLSTSHGYNTEEKKNGKKMPKTKDVGPTIGSLSFTLPLSALQGNDVKAEHDWWVSECEKGTYSYIYMGGAKFGNYKWRVNKVDMNDLVTINNGTLWKSCTLSIGFEEYYVKVKKTKAEKKAERLLKKMRRALDKSMNAKNERARAKAAAQAAKLKTQYEEQKVIAAKERAEQTKKNAQAVQLFGQYYDALNAGEDYKLLLRKIKEEMKKERGT
jgi:hypothetical protein